MRVGRSIVRTLLRYLGLFAFALTLALFLAMVAFYQTAIPQNLIRLLVQQELSKTFKQPITIDSISGNLFTKAKVHNIRFYNPQGFKPGTALKIGSLTLHYSLIDVLRFKGDVMKASPYLEVDDLKVYLLRDAQNR